MDGFDKRIAVLRLVEPGTPRRLLHPFNQLRRRHLGLLVITPTGGIVFKCRIWALALREQLLGGTGVRQPADHAVIPFMTAAFIHLILLIAVLRQFLNGGPGPWECRGILDRDLKLGRIRVEPFVALNQVQILTRSVKICLLSEVRYVDNESVTFPMGPGVPKSLAHAFRQMRAIGDGNDPAETLALADVA